MNHEYTKDELKYAFKILLITVEEKVNEIGKEVPEKRTWRNAEFYDDITHEFYKNSMIYAALVNSQKTLENSKRDIFPLSDNEMILVRDILEDADPSEFIDTSQPIS